MKRFIASALIVSFAIVQPINAAELLNSMEQTENPMQLIEKALCPSGTFDANAARRFLYQLKKEVQERYGYDLDLHLVLEEAIGTMKNTGKFSTDELIAARELYSQLIEPKTRVANSWHSKKKQNSEFTLPDTMALGYVCIFGGALLCILPFGFTQGLGASLIGSGIVLTAQGAGMGERPYYMDCETGQRITDNSDTGSSVGIGTSF